MQEPLTRDELDRVVVDALGVGLDAVRELTEGTVNTAYALTLIDGRELVLTVAPAPGTPLLSHERGLLATEAMCLRAFAGRPRYPRSSVPGRRGRAATSCSRRCCGGVLAVPVGRGRPGPAAGSAAAGRVARRRDARVTGDGWFGDPSGPSSAPTWSEAYRRIIAALLADVERYAVQLPVPAGRLAERLSAAAEELLGPVTTPVLVHHDLWDGNVVIDLTGDEPTVTGFIDAERALWADPAADLFSLALLGDIAEDADFLAGYTEAGGRVVLDEATRARLHLYRAHLALVMIVEVVPRGTAAPANAAGTSASRDGWSRSSRRWTSPRRAERRPSAPLRRTGPGSGAREVFGTDGARGADGNRLSKVSERVRIRCGRCTG